MLSTAIIRLSNRGRVPAEASAAVLSSRFNSQCSLRGGSNNNNSSSRSISSTVPWSCHPQIIIANNKSHHQQRVLHQNYQIQRWFASDTTKNGDSEEVDTAATATDDDNDGNSPSSVSGSSQHDTWVQFQRSIAVSGFETGQTVREKDLGKKNRGGKVDRKRKEREAEAEAALRGEDVTQLKGGEFPALRYSDEETERLLAEAYAAIPPRAGKRGTNHLKREKRRWQIKREYDAKKKAERIGAHTRRMAKRARINQEIKQVRVEAPSVREEDSNYQEYVLQRWAEMNGHSKDATM